MSHVTSPVPRLIAPGDLITYLDGNVSGNPILLFDWALLGKFYTAIRFVLINTGAAVLTVTPQAAYLPDGPPEVGSLAPVAFTVQPGECYGDPYGIDEMRPYWRVWVNGSTTFKWGILGIPR